MILAVEAPGAPIVLYALDARAPFALPFASGPEPVQLTALYYDEPLELLLFDAGPLLTVEEAPNRALPSPDDVWTWLGPGGTWTSAGSDLPVTLASVQLAPPPLDRCIGAGGCLAAPVAGASCNLPCEVAPPAFTTPIPVPPQPPAVPSPSCPTAWALRGDNSASCEPPAAAPVTCPDGQVQHLDAVSCAPIGAPCPLGQWRDDVVAAGRVLHVAPGGSGSGTRADPFGTIGDAMAEALPGDVVLLARGVYAEQVTISAGVAVVGACVTGSAIDTRGLGLPSVTTQSAGTSLRDVTLRADQFGAGAEGAGLLRVEGVLVDGVGHGLVADRSGRLEARDVLVRGFGDAGAIAYRGGALDARRVVVARGRGPGIRVSDPGSTAVLEDVVVRELDQSVVSVSQGVVYLDRASGSVTRVLIDRARGDGLSVQTATVSAINVVVRDVQPDAILAGQGIGIAVDRGVLTLRSSIVERSIELGVWAHGSGTVIFEDVVVRGVVPAAGNLNGNGIAAVSGAVVRLFRVAIEDVQGAGIHVVGGAVFADDLQVRDIYSDTNEGSGLNVAQGTLTLTRGAVESLANPGLRVHRDGSVTLNDVAIRDLTRAGVLLHPDSAVTATRMSIERVTTGIGAFGGRLVANELSVRELVRNDDETSGVVLLSAFEATQVDVTNAHLEGRVETGFARSSTLAISLRLTRAHLAGGEHHEVLRLGGAAVATLREIRVVGGARALVSAMEEVHVEISGLLAECAESAAAGVGLEAMGRPTVQARALAISGCALGVSVAGSGATLPGVPVSTPDVALEAGEIADCGIGVRVASPGYALEKLLAGVRFLRNGTNLDVEAP